MKERKGGNNRKRTKSRNHYFQTIYKDVPVYENRIVEVKNKWYHKLLLRFKLVKWEHLVKAKDVIVRYRSVPDKTIKHNILTKRKLRQLKRVV